MMMAAGAETGIKYVGGTTATIPAGVLDHPVALPPGVVAGDLIIVALAASSGTGSSNPMEPTTLFYSLRFDSNDVLPRCAYHYKTATGSDTLTVTGSSSKDAACVVQVFRGVSSTYEFDAYRTDGASTSGAPNCPSITTATDGAMVIALGFTEDDDITSVTAPSGFENLDWIRVGSGTGDAATVMMASRILEVAGTINPDAFVTGQSDSYWAVTDALLPA